MASPQIARGERIYAVGDVHGRLDLFSDIVRRIRSDAEHLPPRRTRLILIGDVVDRGPDSRALVEHLCVHAGDPNLIVLRGNHEQMMLNAVAGDMQSLTAWLRFGGDATLRSWNFSDEELALDPSELAHVLKDRFPKAVLSWIRQLPFSYKSGDFFFAHAGISPGVPLDEQEPGSLMWIGDEFLSFEGDHPAVIVHGHTIVETGPDIRRNRIALDTGAYRTNRLSAVCFEGSRQWTIVTSAGADASAEFDIAEHP